MLESHNSLSTGLLWLLLSQNGGEAGSNDQCSVERGPALQDFLSPLHFKKQWATKVLMILNWSMDGAAISDQFSLSSAYQVSRWLWQCVCMKFCKCKMCFQFPRIQRLQMILSANLFDSTFWRRELDCNTRV